MKFLCVLCILVTLVQFSKQGKPNFCNLKLDRGSCSAFGFRYHYNRKNNQCELFGYTGCGGNKNNFRTRYECMSTCSNQRG
ncbi:hypothetical protein Btru_024755 [Bulinus truncatus]|nr:hypothetical protein Btru_024755 [Bulinus truncatus]